MPELDEYELRLRTSEILNRHPAVGFAVGVVRPGGLDLFDARGFADIEAGTRVTEDTVFRIASITKTFTAIAVMQLWERGLVDLDAPANGYLRAFRLEPVRASMAPVTLRHLLTHTSGLPEVMRAGNLLRPLFGETVPAGQPVPELADWYAGALRVYSEPGTTYTYTDHNFATLGQVVADVSGRSLAGYLREHVFDPLGMASTDLDRSDRLGGRVAAGYVLGRRGPRRLPEYDLVPAAAGAAFASPRDMGRYLAALLGGGANQHGSVLKPETIAQMFAPQYQPDPRVPGMGLGFWRGDVGGHPIVDHGGILPGYNAEIFAAPGAGVAVMGFTTGARLAMLWLPGEVSGLLSTALEVPEPRVRTDVAQRPDLWGELCGWYQVPGRLTDARKRETVGLGVEVFVRGGKLMLRGLTPVPPVWRGFELHPDDPDDPTVFRLDFGEFGMGTGRVVFSHDPAAVHFDLMPMSAWKQPDATNPRRMLAATAVTGAAMAAGAAGLRRLVRSRRAAG
jgi:CubicO group peptidase (beta-lactamase class C family)